MTILNAFPKDQHNAGRGTCGRLCAGLTQRHSNHLSAVYGRGKRALRSSSSTRIARNCRGSSVLPALPGFSFHSRRSSSPRLARAAVACTAAVQPQFLNARQDRCWQAIRNLASILSHKQSLSSSLSLDGFKAIERVIHEVGQVLRVLGQIIRGEND